MKKIFLLLTLIAAVTACKKPITTTPVAKLNSYLVVDGHISVGDSSVIVLSRTVGLDSGARSNPELNANVTVESAGGGIYPFTSAGKGIYRSAVFNIPAGQTCRLKITTADGKKYESDYVPVKNSPAIDAVNYDIKGDGLAITIDSHDAANATRYYRWDYTDTYIVQSQYYSKFIVVNGDTTDFRKPEQQIYQCWVTDSSSTIVLGSSLNLASDKISKQQVAFLKPNAESLRIKFSILVKQYALTAEAFAYFEALKRNSTQVGGVFDGQPSELTGNIHCITNPAEPVIGYISAGAVAQKRLFVDKSELPAAWDPDLSYYNGCTLIKEEYDYVPPGAQFIEHQVREYVYTGIETPIDRVIGVHPGIIAARPYCADCTLRGTNKQPAFWK